MHVRMRPSRKTVWLLGAATGLQLSFGLLTGFPSALGETLPGIRILDQKISVQLPSGASSAEVTVTLANDASEAIPLALRAELKSGEASITTGTTSLPPASIQVVKLTITPATTGSDLDGRLIAESSDATVSPAAVELEILMPRNLTLPPKVVLGLSALVAGLVVLLRYGWIKTIGIRHPNVKRRHVLDRVTLGTTLGPVDWKFSDSWASNLTAVGAILGTLAAASFVPDRRSYVSKDWLTALNIFFGALLVVAPFIYTALRAPKYNYPKGDAAPKYRGFVGTFLVACAITLWAVLGELGATFLLLREIATTFPGNLAQIVPMIILVAVTLLALIYAWNTIAWTIEAQQSPPRDASKGKATFRMMGGSEEESDNLSEDEAKAFDNTAIESWSVL